MIVTSDAAGVRFRDISKGYESNWTNPDDLVVVDDNIFKCGPKPTYFFGLTGLGYY
jgi:hypothetical protein